MPVARPPSLSAQAEPVQPGPVQPGPVQPGPVQPGQVQADPGQGVLAAAQQRLPADLLKLIERFVAEFPLRRAQAQALSHVPVALRHLLGLQIELRRANGLPTRYQELAAAVTARMVQRRPGHPDAWLARAGLSADGLARLLEFDSNPELDEVDRLVVQYVMANHADPSRAATLIPGLRQFFTESQIVELTLSTALAAAFARFDIVLRLDET